jgi:predicted ATP-grasp superfamily ATP-dependent carboligase
LRPIDISTPVLVLGFQDGGQGIARSLGRLGVSVYAVTGQAASSALASRYLSDSVVWKLGQTNPDVSIDFLLHYAQRNGGRMVLLPATDEATLFVARYAASLHKRFLFPRLPAAVVESLSHAASLRSLARRFDIPVASGAEDEAGQTWLFAGYFDRASRCRAGFTGRQLRGGAGRSAATGLGISLENRAITQLTVDFLQRIRYRGLVDVSWVQDRRDGRYKLLHVRPRVESHFRLFLGTDEMDVVRYFYLDQTGQPLPSSMMLEGRKWLAEDRDLRSLLGAARTHTLSLSSLLQSYRGVQEYAWFARDDWRPFLRRMGSLAGRAVSQPWPAVSSRRRLSPAPDERKQRALVSTSAMDSAASFDGDWRASGG